MTDAKDPTGAERTADPSAEDVARAAMADGLPSLGLSAADALAQVRARMGLSDEPRTIGGYRIVRRLGAGAMGVVYLAEDDQLGRKVAIKLLAAGRRDPAREERLVREARGLARLQHPNVVTVHEVGRHEGAVFLAMEYAPGGDLASWLAAEPRPLPDILRRFREAGAGLAAAHDQGLVHRDFKPANVLLDAHGHAKVADFGLVRAAGEEVELGSEEGLVMGAQGASGSQELTRTGAMVGTPAYMAPEVAIGAPADARSDQFSFCVALYEAVAGVRPFAGQSLVAITLSIQRGRLQAPARGRTVPPWLTRVVQRGLAQDPADRYLDMHALVRALERRSRRPMIAATVALVGLGAAAGVFAARAGDDPCAQGAARIAKIWNDEARAGITAAFADANLPYGKALQASVLGALDQYVAAWADGYRHACEDTQVLGAQSEAAMDLRMACLGRRRSALEQALAVLGEASPRELSHAYEVASGLPALDTCSDATWLREHAALPEDPKRRAQVQAQQARLDAARASFRAGDLEGAQAIVDEVSSEIDALGWPRLVAERDQLLGQISLESGHLDQADDLLHASMAEALAAGADDTAAWTATTGVHLAATRQRDPKAARMWQWLAEPLAERVPSDPVLRSAVLSNHANALLMEGKAQESIALRERGIQILVDALGEDNPRVAEQRANLGTGYRRVGQPERAVALYLEARDAMERAYGAMHPKLGQLYNNLGVAYSALEDFDAARQAYARSLEIKRATLRAGHPSLGHSYNNLAEALMELGQIEDARASAERAEAIWREALGDAHPLVVEALAMEARVWAREGKADRAAEILRQALDAHVAEGGGLAASVAWELAQLLDARLGEKTAAIERARYARREFSAAGRTREVEAVDAWLEERGVSAAPLEP